MHLYMYIYTYQYVLYVHVHIHTLYVRMYGLIFACHDKHQSHFAKSLIRYGFWVLPSNRVTESVGYDHRRKKHAAESRCVDGYASPWKLHVHVHVMAINVLHTL